MRFVNFHNLINVYLNCFIMICDTSIYKLYVIKFVIYLPLKKKKKKNVISLISIYDSIEKIPLHQCAHGSFLPQT